MTYSYGSISFREPSEADAQFFLGHLNESALTKRDLSGWVNGLLTLESEQEYLRSQISGQSGEQYYCILNEEGRLIGSCSIMDWDARSQKCTIGIFIADPQARGKGHGSDAMELLLLIAFTELNCRKVKLNVFSWNSRAIYLYERKGFVREGVLREEAYTMGQWHDEYVYALFRDDWYARVHAEGRRESL